MAKLSVSEIPGLRPALNPDAPWSAKVKKGKAARDMATRVVYVIAQEGDVTCKIGCTSNIKKRLGQLSRETGKAMHIMFWAEFQHEDSFRIERAAINLLRRMPDAPQKGEWFKVAPAIPAEAILRVAANVGVRPINQAGIPGSVEHSVSEVEEMLMEVGRDVVANFKTNSHNRTGTNYT